uniref:Uncharacterized protein n=1 Tax=Anguilla anguilla TaxID=7936 RepID=A0A0E9QJQ5_ANGAN
MSRRESESEQPLKYPGWIHARRKVDCFLLCTRQTVRGRPVSLF